jgi:glycosyltransferase involved in cell wall biosynthesis
MDDLGISVVIPTYNRAELILRALASVFLAIGPGDEVIVVDDGSTDHTHSVLTPYAGRIRCVQGEHRGVGAARNLGLSLATRPLVAFLDSDDEWYPDKLQLQRAFLRARPDVLFCSSNMGLRYDDGRPERHFGLVGWHLDPQPWSAILGPGLPYSTLAPLPPGRSDFLVHIGNLYPAMVRGSYVPTQTVLVWRQRAGDALRFPEDITLGEDHECWTRVSRLGPAAYFDCETFWQWGHSGPRLSRAEDGYGAACRIKVLERTFGADAEFLAQHQPEYERLLRDQRLTLTRALIGEGRLSEARAELRRAGGGPLSYRMLAACPGPVVRGALRLREALRGAPVV